MMIEMIQKKIRENGYYYGTTPSDFQGFQSICSKLGEVIHWHDIRIDDSSDFIISKSDEILFHTDFDFIGYIGWYCIQQDSKQGDSLLIDSNDLDEYFSGEELSSLERIHMFIPRAAKNTSLLSDHNGKRKLFYVPWNLKEPDDEYLNSLLKKFQKYLLIKKTSCLRISMKPGQYLLIEDGRMLHGREKISNQSQRFLKRAWIRAVSAF